jgi:glycosyltransferase involved in cell wall biosynthesis
MRRRWNVPPDAFVVLHSGAINDEQGCHWMIDSALRLPPDVYLVLQSGGRVEQTFTAACRLAGEQHRLRGDFGEYVSWSAMDQRIAAADVGLVFYFHTGPQFQNMGICSNKLCLFLRGGVPVVVTQQPSFGFLEKYRCGVLVDNRQQMLDAIAHIRANHAEYRANALRCYREYVDVDLYRPAVVEAFRRLLSA